jgi:hypothetical protein
MEEQKQSFGQKAVGMTFNPSKDPIVDEIKKLCADVIDRLRIEYNVTQDDEKKRMYSIAITEIQTAQMWGVKAATWSS